METYIQIVSNGIYQNTTTINQKTACYKCNRENLLGAITHNNVSLCLLCTDSILTDEKLKSLAIIINSRQLPNIANKQLHLLNKQQSNAPKQTDNLTQSTQSTQSAQQVNRSNKKLPSNQLSPTLINQPTDINKSVNPIPIIKVNNNDDIAAIINKTTETNINKSQSLQQQLINRSQIPVNIKPLQNNQKLFESQSVQKLNLNNTPDKFNKYKLQELLSKNNSTSKLLQKSITPISPAISQPEVIKETEEIESIEEPELTNSDEVPEAVTII